MIVDGIQIQSFRGVRTGEVTGLGPLTVVVGRNSSGKSTVLEALFIGAQPDIGTAVGLVVARRWDGDDSPRWLFLGGDRTLSPTLVVKAAQGLLGWETALSGEAHEPARVRSIRRLLGDRDLAIADTTFQPSGSFASAGGRVPGLSPADLARVIHGIDPNPPVPRAKLVDPSRDVSALAKLFESLYPERLDVLAIDVMKSMIPGLVDVRSTTSGVLWLQFAGHSVPISVQGDGARVLARTTFELAAPKDSLVLVEEPEAHLHPGALRIVARVLRETVARGVQVVLTTHSIELIDAIVRELEERPIDEKVGALDPLRVVRTSLEDGVLRAVTIAGADVGFAREEVHEDLR